ncbi:FHA domain-containing protein [Cryptosporangium sp. NPDC048952]|uniref:FHA domain-containing protein n=1 Tax=Cryptosporangium sp. NPDC048952 TaxID=3363961 RepID=UPI00371847A2
MTTGSTEEKPDDRALAPVSGSGLLARYGDLVLLYAAPEGDDERTAEVLDAIASAAGGDGRRLGRRLASLLLTAGNQDLDFPPLAAFGPVGDGVAVIVHGAAQVSVVTDDGEIVLDGRDALTWVDRMIPAPARVIRGALDTLGGGSHDPWSRLDAGVVRAGGFVFGVPSAIAAAPSPAGAPSAPLAAAPVRPLSAVPSPPEASQPAAPPAEPSQPESSRLDAFRSEPAEGFRSEPADDPQGGSVEAERPRAVPPPTEVVRRVPTSPSITSVPSEIEDDDVPQSTEAYNPFTDDSAVRPLPSAPEAADDESGPSRGAASVQRGGYEPPAAFSAPTPPPAPAYDDPVHQAPPVPTFDDPAYGTPAPPAPPSPFGDSAPPPPPFGDSAPPAPPFGDAPPPPPFGEPSPLPPPPPGGYDGPVHTPTGPSPVLPDQPLADQAVQPSSAPPAPAQPDARGGYDPAAPFEAVLLIGDQAEVEDRSQTSGPLPPADVQPPPGPVPADGAEEADARPIVLGIYCKNDHFNDPRVPYCAVCGISMAQLTHVSRTGPRPPLGLLVLDDGATFRLDTDYVVGREPERDDAVLQGRARALRIDDPKGVVSRIHARIELDGWDVNVVDLASANGTHIAPPNSESWTRLEAHRKVTLTPGTRVVFGRRGFRYESHRNP